MRRLALPLGLLILAIAWIIVDPRGDSSGDSNPASPRSPAAAETEFDLPKGESTAIPEEIEAAPKESRDLTTPPAPRVSGVVLDEARSPVPNATIECAPHSVERDPLVPRPWQFVAETDANGRFEGPVTDIWFSVRATATGFPRVVIDHLEADQFVEVVLRSPGFVTGTVVTRSGPAPSGTLVHFRRSGDGARLGRAELDEDGTYRSPPLPRIPVGITVVAPGHPVTGATVSLDHTPHATRDFMLQAGCVTRGVVRDATSGEPVAHADVRVESGEVSETRADADGRFVLRGLEPVGLLILSAEAPGYARVHQSIDPQGAAEFELVLELSRGVTIDGRVEWPDGTPAVGADVSCLVQSLERTHRWHAGRTDSKGEYSIPNVATRCRVEVFARHGRRVAHDKFAVELDDTEAPPLVLTESAVLEGVATRGGEPVADAAIVVVFEGALSNRSGRWTRTRADGTYRVVGMPPGEVRVTLHDSIGERPTRDATLFPGESTRLDFALDPIDPQRSGRLTGRVTTESGWPVSASVRAAERDRDGPGSRTVSAGSGYFNMNGLDPDAEYQLTVSSPFAVDGVWYKPAVVNDVRSGDHCSVVLLPAAIVSGQVRGAEGAVVPGAYVEVRTIEGRYFGSARADERGHFAVPVPDAGAILVGRYTQWDALYSKESRPIFADALSSEPRPVAADASGLTLSLPATSTIEGHARDDEGRPLAGVHVAVKLAGQESRTSTDGDGRFVLLVPRSDAEFQIVAALTARATHPLPVPAESTGSAIVTTAKVVDPPLLLTFEP